MNCLCQTLVNILIVLAFLDRSLHMEVNNNRDENIACRNKSDQLQGYACKTEEFLKLNFEWFKSNPANSIQLNPRNGNNCRVFKKSNDSFLANIQSNLNEDLAFCDVYDIYLSANKRSFYVNGTSLSQVESQCSNREEICVQEIDNQECPLVNFNISPILVPYSNVTKYISLNMSWEPCEESDEVSIALRPTTSDCYFGDIPHQPINNNTVLIPEAFPDPQVLPSCTYEVFISSAVPTTSYIDCKFDYTVPECVEEKCDCKKYAPDAVISKVEHISDNRYMIYWNPASSTIEDLSFSYKKSNNSDFSDMVSDAQEIRNDMENFNSEIVMHLIKGETYTLIGNFKNNYSCRKHVNFRFKAPKKNEYLVAIILIGVVIIGLMISLKHKNIIKIVKQISKIMQSNNLQQECHLSRLQQCEVPMNVNDQYIPFEPDRTIVDKYEFPKNRIIIQELIGSGAFGRVFSAKAVGMETHGFKMVAVKTLDKNASTEAVTDFLAEIDIFKKIGGHPNVVTLKGCCTMDPPFMMIMEFVPCGDLKHYLITLRDHWLIKNNIKQDQQVFFPNDGALGESTLLMRSFSSTSSYTVLERALDHKELQDFALQIARGMAHLEKIPITHRDLAARNVLINEYKTLKISDFGLSRCGPYINRTTKKFPLRWMAVEAITDQKYDSKSDVWSFGVVLWEIGTLGGFPYRTIPDSFIQQFLQMGKRLERPEICTDELYSLMGQCWAGNPDERPTFQELVDRLDARKIYVHFDQLNPTYVFPPCDTPRFCPV